MCIVDTSAKQSKENDGISIKKTSSFSTTGVILKGLYVILSYLCVMMVLWILVLPASWKMGHSETHDRFIREEMFHESKRDEMPVPIETITKYAGHSAVQFSHILPGAFWAGAIPFQLNPYVRKHYRTVHRRMGYIFVATSLLMTVGIFLIEWRGLSFHVHDYPDLPPKEIMGGRFMLPLLGFYFAFTAMWATVKAIQKDFVTHQRYIIRHVSSGIWVALQRLFVGFSKGRSRHDMREAFTNGVYVGVFLSFAAGELAIYLIQKSNTKKQIKKKE